MDIDALSAQERPNMLAEVADMYYNQQKTQIEIAQHFGTTRFKVARLLQDARSENIVEITIHYANERSRRLEEQLMDAFGLKAAIVVNTKYASHAEGVRQIGQVGASYVDKLLHADSTLGIMWGKTIQPIVDQLPQTANKPVSVVQLAGQFSMPQASVESRALVQAAVSAYFGTAYYFNTPLYVTSEDLRARLMEEPGIKRTLEAARRLDVVLTGIGGSSSLPLTNKTFEAYLTEGDLARADACAGSIYGCVFDDRGEVADIDLNRRLMATPIEDIMRAEHRIGVARGRNKAPVAERVARSGLINELITDSQTASLMLNEAE